MSELLCGIIRFDAETLGIISTTLCMAISSTAISASIGIFLGLLMEKTRVPFKNLIVRFCRTMMGMPPVVVGLVVYLLLMRKGPLGFLNMLFTVRGMVVAQILIITPIISGMVYSCAATTAPHIRAFAKTMGANGTQTRLLMIKEMSNEIYFAVITGFGRAISEVGSVMIVGGNIQYKTRIMTTTISMMRNKGEYSQAITLGIVLLVIAFLLQSVSDFLRKEEIFDENF